MTYQFFFQFSGVLLLCTKHNYSEQIAKIVSLTNFSLTFLFKLNTPHTFYWGGYNFELNRDKYFRGIAWNPPSFEWARNDWNENHCEQYCYVCLYCQPTKTALCYSFKVAVVDFQYAYSSSYAMVSVVGDNTHEWNSKRSPIWEIIKKLRRQKHL